MRSLIIVIAVLLGLISAARVRVRSPTPELIAVDRKRGGFNVRQKDSSAYLEYQTSGQTISLKYISAGCFIRHYRGIVKSKDMPIDSSVSDEPEYIYWTLAIMPADNPPNMEVREWMSLTQFKDDNNDNFENWIGFRSDLDDYTVAIIESFTSKMPEKEESPELSVTIKGEPITIPLN